MCALELAGARPVNEAQASVAEWFGARAADVDAGGASVRGGLAELGRRGLAQADIADSMALVRSVAREDMATAFSAWAHRMTIDYISSSPDPSAALGYLPALATADTLGATALAAGTAHVLASVPLPVTFRSEDDDLILEGRIPWASNLIDPFLVVTAAVDADDPRRTLVAAVPSHAGGLELAPYPELLALGATGSTTVKLNGVRVSRELVVSDDLPAFVDAVLARFLLLQGAFCSGLANRSLEEADTNLGPMGDGIRGDLHRTRAAVDEADALADRLASDALAGRGIATDQLLRLRLQWSEVTATAVHLELAATGGRGYLSGSPTARRLREAAFLPVQAPTEVLLRWLLSRSR